MSELRLQEGRCGVCGAEASKTLTVRDGRSTVRLTACNAEHLAMVRRAAITAGLAVRS